MVQRDSFDKIVERYFHAVACEEFEYKGKIYPVVPLLVSPLIFRGYTCPPMCGGCCPRFSLDYIPGDSRPNGTPRRWIRFNKLSYTVWSDTQEDHGDHFCRNLDKDQGRCGIHGKQPFSCDFELLRFHFYQDRVILNQQLFGRGWNFLRVDGERGALCEMIPFTPEWKEDLLRRLKRLSTWATYFGLSHSVEEIIAWVKTGPHLEPLLVEKRNGAEASKGHGKTH